MEKTKNELKVFPEIKLENNLVNILVDHTKKIMWTMVDYKELQMVYTCALKEVKTKFDILSTEFNIKNKRNPIATINYRLKRTKSIVEKLMKLNLPITLENMEEHIFDFAGIRVICSYIDDIYTIAEALLKQDDIILIDKKDYIKNPKKNGYRSLHLIIKVPVFLSGEKKEVYVEVQIRTIAMDFWASLEHQMKYKKGIPNQDDLNEQLLQCANVINKTDEKMLELRKKIEIAEDVEDEDSILLEKMSRLDMPF